MSSVGALNAQFDFIESQPDDHVWSCRDESQSWHLIQVVAFNGPFTLPRAGDAPVELQLRDDCATGYGPCFPALFGSQAFSGSWSIEAAPFRFQIIVWHDDGSVTTCSSHGPDRVPTPNGLEFERSGATGKLSVARSAGTYQPSQPQAVLPIQVTWEITCPAPAGGASVTMKGTTIVR